MIRGRGCSGLEAGIEKMFVVVASQVDEEVE